MPSVTPAYGRDYISEEEAIEAWENGSDFILADCSSPFNGMYCSIRDFDDELIEIRFDRKRELAVYRRPV